MKPEITSTSEAPKNATTMEIRTLFSEGNLIDSYNIFEKVRKQVEDIVSNKEFLSENKSFVMRLKMSFWIFDRLINGPWEFGNTGVKKIINEQGLEARCGSDSKYIFRPLIDLNGEFIDESRIQTWAPIIALYSKAKDILLINEAYYQAMGTTPAEFAILVREGRTAELLKKEDLPKLQELTFILSQGKGYKNELLHPARTRKTISWNSSGNEGSGSIRIGKDVTFGEHPAVPKSEFKSFVLDAGKSMDIFLEKTKAIIEKMPESHEKTGIQRRLLALSTCANAVDMFWEHGPYFMNIWSNGLILGNQNYSDLIGRSAVGIKPEELYTPEILLAIEKKFIEGYKTGHYEDSFSITSSGVSRNIAWHRYFPKNAYGLEKSMTFGIGTSAITSSQKRSI
ncbi:hypothetical protein AUJ87_00355 [Candidatus Gracilibacteria bacterium CG1_02_38_174]|nr:MAG: hypothetical protein AUJ87_00355 [Candidatus Gracilibacteria bacterium CG1_02_38_174]